MFERDRTTRNKFVGNSAYFLSWPILYFFTCRIQDEGSHDYSLYTDKQKDNGMWVLFFHLIIRDKCGKREARVMDIIAVSKTKYQVDTCIRLMYVSQMRYIWPKQILSVDSVRSIMQSQNEWHKSLVWHIRVKTASRGVIIVITLSVLTPWKWMC